MTWGHCGRWKCFAEVFLPQSIPSVHSDSGYPHGSYTLALRKRLAWLRYGLLGGGCLFREDFPQRVSPGVIGVSRMSQKGLGYLVIGL
jgi:hypothetical protein